MSARPRRPTRGFTLIELLVVIAIIGMLVLLLLPAVQAAREAARMTQCRNRLRQLAIAATNFESLRGHLPPGVTAENDDLQQGMHSGFVFLLPFLEEEALFAAYDFDQSWTSPVNVAVGRSTLTALRCPSSESIVPDDPFIRGAATDYAFSKGPFAYLCAKKPAGGGMFDVNSRVRIAMVKDGMSKTIALGEAASSRTIAAAST